MSIEEAAKAKSLERICIEELEAMHAPIDNAHSVQRAVFSASVALVGGILKRYDESIHRHVCDALAEKENKCH